MNQEVEERQEPKIPEVKLDDKGIFQEETKEIPLKVNGEMKNVVLRKLNAGTRGMIRARCTKTKVLGGQQQMDINDAELEAQLLQAAIVSAPFPHDLQAVKKFPSEVFDYLMMEFQEMAGVTDKKKD